MPLRASPARTSSSRSRILNVFTFIALLPERLQLRFRAFFLSSFFFFLFWERRDSLEEFSLISLPSDLPLLPPSTPREVFKK